MARVGFRDEILETCENFRARGFHVGDVPGNGALCGSVVSPVGRCHDAGNRHAVVVDEGMWLVHGLEGLERAVFFPSFAVVPLAQATLRMGRPGFFGFLRIDSEQDGAVHPRFIEDVVDGDERGVRDRFAESDLRRGRVRPLGLDRYGVRLRVENEDGDHDVRLAFAEPVDDVSGLSRAIRVLMGCPFLNGLRARRPLP